MKKSLYTVLILVLLIVFGISAFFVGRYVIQSKQEADRYDQLSQMKEQPTTPPTVPTQQPTQPAQTTEATASPEPTEAPTQPTEPQILEEYAQLYAMNNDMVGWIQIDGTKIDYPVLQTPANPNYYIDRNFDKEYSAGGAIYAWGDADINEPSDNITLFGHHMKNGSMFAALNNYTQKGYLEENNLIVFDTLTQKHTYRIFAVFKTTANVGDFQYHQFVDAQNEQEFNDFVSTCKSLARKTYFDTDITPVYGDKLLTLSTCEYTLGDNGRLVVCAVRWS